MTVLSERPPAGPGYTDEDSADGNRRTRRSGPAWFGVSALLLAGLAPLLLIGSTATSGHSPWPWAVALATVVGLRYSWLVAEGAENVYELMFWLFSYTFLCLAPLVQLRTGVFPGTTPNLEHGLDAAALAVVGAGLLAFSIGALAAGHGPVRLSRQRDVVLLPSRVIVLTTTALLLSALYVLRVGPSAFFDARGARDAAEAIAFSNPTVLAAVKAAATLPLLVCFAALCRLARQGRADGRRASILPAVLVLLTLLVVVNPISSPRYFSGTAVLSILFSLRVVDGKTRARVFALLLAAGLVIVFPYADLTRRSALDTANLSAHAGPTASLSSSDFDAFEQVNNSIAYVRDNGYTNLRQLEGAVFFFVPRQVWHNKPEDTGIVLAQYREAPTTNLSAPVWAELFLARGWASVLLGMAALGAVLRRLDRRGLADRTRHAEVSPVATVLPFYMIIMLRGSLLQSMAGFAVLAASGLFVSARRQLPAAPPSRSTRKA